MMGARTMARMTMANRLPPPEKTELIRRLAEPQRQPDRQAHHRERHHDGDDHVDRSEPSQVEESVLEIVPQSLAAGGQNQKDSHSDRTQQSKEGEERGVSLQPLPRSHI